MDQRSLSGRMLNAYEEHYQLPLGVAVLLLLAELVVGERRRPGAAETERGAEAA